MTNKECVFCAIIQGSLSTEIIKETKNLIVIKDISPQAPIHYLIISKKHYHDLLSVPADECCMLSAMLKLAQELGKDAGDFKLILNNGYNAGQRVFHLHMHFLAGKELEGI